ncbi:iron-containing alcohol dehydrogenase [Klebsiella quasipneumoniae]|uniref:iron-containing alcohol dehydrogenase n=1 Tax=Klebsiella quasipneumoniae TaxID=1463165 RepID=UPI001F23A1DF|nr:iron-containing alcohol dehydrogenase [Klebsiella quasipneumoniae]
MATIHSTIISGAGASSALLPLLAGKTSILLVTDKNVGALEATQAIHRLLAAEGRVVEVIDTVPAEPSHHDVAQIVSQLDASQPQLVVGIGGGSVLDVAKLLSVLLHPEAPALTALLAGEQPQRRIGSLLIPATAGTGSEATPNAILAIPEQQTKVGIISPVLLPDYVALLPELTTSMPASIAASTGIDALCHLLEMLWASWYGGAAINHAGTHLVHALSYPLGGTWHLPHGVANAILLAPCMRVIRPHAVVKFAQVWDLIPDADRTLSEEEKSHALVAWLAALVKRLPLPDNLAALGVPQESIPALSAAAQNVKRLMNNAPCSVSREEIAAIYQTLFPGHA